MMIRKLLGTVAIGGLLAACAAIATHLDQLQTDVSQLLVSGQAQLTAVSNVALAMTPPNTDLDNCAKAGGTVLAAAAKLTAASNTADNSALVAAAVATAYVPGSDQYTWAQNTLVEGCAVEVQKTTGNVVGAGAVLSAIPGLLKLAPLAAAAP